jgi:hypothetical protein
MTILRTKCLSTRLSDEEYAALERAAGPQTLGTWAREILIAAARSAAVVAPPHTGVLEEIVALRTVLLNLEYARAVGDAVTVDRLRSLIDRADQDRFARAADRLAETTARGGR